MLIGIRKESFMDTLRTVLSTNPEIGIMGTVMAFFSTLIETLSPFCRFLTLVVGLGIGYLTLRIKLYEWMQIRKQRKENLEKSNK